MRGPELMQENRAEGYLTKSRCSVASASQCAQIICHTEVPAMCVMLELKESQQTLASFVAAHLPLIC